MSRRNEETRQKVLSVIKNSNNLLDVNYISNEAGVHWHTAHRIIIEEILLQIMEKSPDIFDKISIRPLKTTKSWVFTSQQLEGI